LTKNAEHMTPQKRYVTRWGKLDRITHVLVLCGVVLGIVSGLPVYRNTLPIFDGISFAWMTSLLLGEGMRRILHRYTVTFLVGLAVVLLGLDFSLRNKRTHIRLTLRDIKDFVAYYRNLFFHAPEPKLGFHIPGEKIFFWVAVVCLPLLGSTGLLMWTRTGWLPYYLLSLLHEAAFLLLSFFVVVHFSLTILLRKEWPVLKAMFTYGRVERGWVEEHHPLAFQEEQYIKVTTRRRFITSLLWAIPAAALGVTIWRLSEYPEFKVSNLTIEPAKAEVGKSISVSVEVENVGYRQGVYVLQMTVDGAMVSEKQVALMDGQATLVSLETSIQTEGIHELAVKGLKGSVEVVPLPPPLPPIEPALAEKFKRLLPDAVDFKPVGKDGKVIYYEGYNNKGILIGYAFGARAYAETDKLEIVGIVDLDYRVVAIDVEPLPGTGLVRLGIAQPAFDHEFVGLSVKELHLSPDGKVDAVTGATMSSAAVTDAIREKIEEIMQTISSKTASFLKGLYVNRYRLSNFA